MIATDEDALICDFAETYGIYEWRALPVSYAAKLAYGLRDDSRIKQSVSGVKASQDTMLLAASLDALNLIAWLNSSAAQDGRERPQSVLDKLLNAEREDDATAYDTGADFEAARARIMEGTNGN